MSTGCFPSLRLKLLDTGIAYSTNEILIPTDIFYLEPRVTVFSTFSMIITS